MPDKLLGPIGLVHGFVHETWRDVLTQERRSSAEQDADASSAQVMGYAED
jgi:hypothetical protein